MEKLLLPYTGGGSIIGTAYKEGNLVNIYQIYKCKILLVPEIALIAFSIDILTYVGDGT